MRSVFIALCFACIAGACLPVAERILQSGEIMPATTSTAASNTNLEDTYIQRPDAEKASSAAVGKTEQIYIVQVQHGKGSGHKEAH
jgi:hypothetical protein